jgi:hypothetical protein
MVVVELDGPGVLRERSEAFATDVLAPAMSPAGADGRWPVVSVGQVDGGVRGAAGDTA